MSEAGKLADDLAKANEAIRLLENQLQAHFVAEHHPRWISTGALVLVGDIGHDSDGTEFQVLTVSATSITEIPTGLAEWTVAHMATRPPDACQVMVGRGKLPKRKERE